MSENDHQNWDPNEQKHVFIVFCSVVYNWISELTHNVKGLNAPQHRNWYAQRKKANLAIPAWNDNFWSLKSCRHDGLLAPVHSISFIKKNPLEISYKILIKKKKQQFVLKGLV